MQERVLVRYLHRSMEKRINKCAETRTNEAEGGGAMATSLGYNAPS